MRETTDNYMTVQEFSKRSTISERAARNHGSSGEQGFPQLVRLGVGRRVAFKRFEAEAWLADASTFIQAARDRRLTADRMPDGIGYNGVELLNPKTVVMQSRNERFWQGKRSGQPSSTRDFITRHWNKPPSV